MISAESVHTLALTALQTANPIDKHALTETIYQRWLNGELVAVDMNPVGRLEIPGRPEKPELVAPKALPQRSFHTQQGYAAFIHSLCHIEFNAINLALDAVYRFRELPNDFYTDWLRIAAEEAYHFSLLNAHLRSRGFAYGDFTAHNSLWELAVATDNDPLIRMALVPRVQEAHGLDVTPGLIEKLRANGADEAVAILEIILRDEIGHVSVGNRWFNFLCAQRGLEPLQTFQTLLQQVYRGRLHGPFALDIREQAGFSQAELAYFREVG